MSPSYVTLTLIGGRTSSRLASGSLPALPFAYYATVPDAHDSVVAFLEAVPHVPNAGDFAAALFSTSIPDAAVVLAEVNQEDVLRLRFFFNGQPIDEYCTEPGHAIGDELPPSGGDISKLVVLFGIDDGELVSELSTLLQAPRYDDEFGFGTAKERHAEIAQLVGLPPASVGLGYESIQRGMIPDETTPDKLRHFPTDDGFASANLKLRQYTLFCPAEDESDAQIAARFLPDVVAWEDDFLGEPTPELGTVESLRSHILGVFPEEQDQSTFRWLSILNEENDLIEVDLGTGAPDTTRDNVVIYTLSEDVPTEMLSRLCDGTLWSVWSYETRQTVIAQSAALPD